MTDTAQLSSGAIPVAEAEPTTIVAADIVLFGRQDGRLRLLTIQRLYAPYQGRWALPGGMLESGESLEQAAVRELAEETGIQVAVEDLTEIGAYSAPGRDPRGQVVSVAYAAVLPDCPAPQAGDDAGQARWTLLEAALDDPTLLAFDHHRIVADAAEQLAGRLDTGVLEGIGRAVAAFAALAELDRVAYETELGQLRKHGLHELLSGLNVVRGLVGGLIEDTREQVQQFAGRYSDLDEATSALWNAGEVLSEVLADLAD